METAISTFSKSLATFCSHVETSSRALSLSPSKGAPFPLVESAASTFLQSVDRRISSTSADLNLLESMALGTVSFEELLGHCNEVYKTNQKYFANIEDRMRSFGYVPEMGLDDDDDDNLEFLSPKIGSKRLDFSCGSVSAVRSNRKRLEEELLFEDSLSLKNLGLSDACLATLASEDNDCPASPMLSSQNAIKTSRFSGFVSTSNRFFIRFRAKIAFRLFWLEDNQLKYGSPGKTKTMIKISKDDYDSLPSYMKSLASWEELQGAVVKLNNYICKKEGATECSAINQDDLELALGHKGGSYLLLLLRMKQLVVETVDGGSIQYRPC